MEFPTNVIGAK